MGKHIADYDHTEMIIALLEVLEITGDNKVIQKLKDESWQQLKEFMTRCDPDYLVGLMLRIREAKK